MRTFFFFLSNKESKSEFITISFTHGKIYDWDQELWHRDKPVTWTGAVSQLDHQYCSCQLQTSLDWPSRLPEQCCKLYRQARLIVIARILSVRMRALLCQRSYSPGSLFPSFPQQPRTCGELLHCPIILASAGCQTATGAWALLLGHGSPSARAAIATCYRLRSLHSPDWFLTVQKAPSPSW